MPNVTPFFLGLPEASLENSHVVLLPLPWEGSVSYGRGTSRAPQAIWRASTQIELWDAETGVDFSAVAMMSVDPVVPTPGELAHAYLSRVQEQAHQFHAPGRLVIGVGGDHSVTPPLVRACCEANGIAPHTLTVLHIDAHADLRDSYEGSPCSHASAMARVLELGARVMSVGVRSEEREEHERAVACDRLETFHAQELFQDSSAQSALSARIDALEGPLYVTLDVDALEVHLCPGTGTPEPGGLGWWETLAWLRQAISNNPKTLLVGADVVETAPMESTSVNEDVAARLVTKLIAYGISSGELSSGIHGQT